MNGRGMVFSRYSLVVIENRSANHSLQLATVLQRLNGLHKHAIGTRRHLQGGQAIEHAALVLQQRQVRLEDVIELVRDRFVTRTDHALLVHGVQATVVQAHHTGQQLRAVSQRCVRDVAVRTHDQNEPAERGQDEFATLEDDGPGLVKVQVEELGHPHQLAAEGEAVHVRHPRGVKVGDGGYWVDLLGSAFLAVVHKHDIHFPGIHTSERVVVIVGREMHVIGAGTHLFADMVTGECWDGDDDSIGKS